MQERSLDFARDDDTGIAIPKHIRYTLRGIDPFPHTVISSLARNLSCTPVLLASFVKGFPFSLSHMGRYTGMQKGSLHFGRDDDTGIAIHKHIRCMLHGIDPFPIPSFRAQREIFLALCCFLLLSLKVSPFPLSRIGRYTSIQEGSLHFGRDDFTRITLPLSPRNTIPFLLVYLFPHVYNKIRETLIQSRNLISHVFSTI